ncbi:MAG TPA: hypothetical protein VFU50_03000 [Terriglobales bacterium]|nr:hypothetical protein [Terriglobales bacterium]
MRPAPALFWPEEAAELHRTGRSLTELTAVGPFLQRLIAAWLDNPPEVPEPPDVRQGFLTLTDARATLAANRAWLRGVKGDLQMHSTWSDREGTIAEMATAAVERGYEYMAITDHSKGFKIAGGIDEQQLLRQADEIAKVNAQLRKSGHRLTELRSIELNLNPRGEGDMESSCFPGLDLVLGCFHSSLRTKEDQTTSHSSAMPRLSSLPLRGCGV